MVLYAVSGPWGYLGFVQHTLENRDCGFDTFAIFNVSNGTGCVKRSKLIQRIFFLASTAKISQGIGAQRVKESTTVSSWIGFSAALLPQRILLNVGWVKLLLFLFHAIQLNWSTPKSQAHHIWSATINDPCKPMSFQSEYVRFQLSVILRECNKKPDMEDKERASF